MDRIGERHGVHGLLYVAGCVKMPDARYRTMIYDTALMNLRIFRPNSSHNSNFDFLYLVSCIMYHHAIQLHHLV